MKTEKVSDRMLPESWKFEIIIRHFSSFRHYFPDREVCLLSTITYIIFTVQLFIMNYFRSCQQLPLAFSIAQLYRFFLF